MPISNSEFIKIGIKRGLFPERLYKFRPLAGKENEDRTMAILEKSEFWFASAETFNDPFDCNLSEVLDHKKEDYEAYFTNLGLLPEDRERIEERKSKNPSHVRDLAVAARKKTINAHGILSLSCRYDQILMWSHYASSHNGIVIGLDLLEDPEFFSTPWPVTYNDEYEALNYYANQKESIRKNISTKSNHWRYEEEIRIVKGETKSYTISRNAIKSIHFGCNTPNEKVQSIIYKCKSLGFRDLRFYKATPVHGAFMLSFTEIGG